MSGAPAAATYAVPVHAPLPTRLAAYAGLFLAGVAVGVIGAFVQANRLLVGTVAVPWGTVLVLVTLVLGVRGASWLVGSRVGGAAAYAGWLVATVLLAVSSPSGDLAISDGGRQLAYLLVGVVLGAAASSFPLVERRPRPATGRDAAAEPDRTVLP